VTAGPRGSALLVDAEGRIRQVVRDDLNVAAQHARGGTGLADLVDPADAGKARLFVARLAGEGAITDWEIAVPVDGVPTVLLFAGAAVADGLLVVMARSRDSLEQLNDELMRINNEQANALRAAMKALAGRPARGGAASDNRALEELAKVNNDLANLQRELSKRNIELGRLNEQKSRFLGMAAHDLRTPLGVILSYSDFLRLETADTLSAEHREFIDIIRATSEFMLRLVDDLLDVTTIESGQLRLAPAPADLVGLVGRSVQLNAVLATRKGIEVTFSPPPGPVTAVVDAGKLDQVLNNLLGNAIKFSHPGTVVRVGLAVDGDRAIVTVRDQGQGIPPHEIGRLFTPFGKTSVRGTAGEPSTGLGLAIVRRIVEGHGGTVTVHSEVGSGSTFTVALPLNPRGRPAPL
jgi:two-component system, OmpR family, sensor kinase